MADIFDIAVAKALAGGGGGGGGSSAVLVGIFVNDEQLSEMDKTFNEIKSLVNNNALIYTKYIDGSEGGTYGVGFITMIDDTEFKVSVVWVNPNYFVQEDFIANNENAHPIY